MSEAPSQCIIPKNNNENPTKAQSSRWRLAQCVERHVSVLMKLARIDQLIDQMSEARFKASQERDAAEIAFNAAREREGTRILSAAMGDNVVPFPALDEVEQAFQTAIEKHEHARRIINLAISERNGIER